MGDQPCQKFRPESEITCHLPFPVHVPQSRKKIALVKRMGRSSTCLLGIKHSQCFIWTRRIFFQLLGHGGPHNKGITTRDEFSLTIAPAILYSTAGLTINIFVLDRPLSKSAHLLEADEHFFLNVFRVGSPVFQPRPT